MEESLKDFLARKQHESLIRIIDDRILDAKYRETMKKMDATMARSRELRKSITAQLKNQ